MESFSGDLPDFTDHIPVERGISYAVHDFSTIPCWIGPLTGGFARLCRPHPRLLPERPQQAMQPMPKGILVFMFQPKACMTNHAPGLKHKNRPLSRPAALLAVRGGFEPPVRLIPYGSLANCWFQPLTHLTRSKLNIVPILKRKCGPLLKRDDKVNLNLPFCQINLHLFVQAGGLNATV